jgi:hypothetical protein
MTFIDSVPDIKKGDRITADFLNKIRRASMRSVMLPGMFQNGAMLNSIPVQGGSGRGTVNLLFGRAMGAILGADGWGEGDAGMGMFQPVTTAGFASGDEVECLNRFFTGIRSGAPMWVLQNGSVYSVISADCTTGPSLEEPS